ncbi:plasmid replication protein, CyRepA1 family (plasmid) [Synechococcus elongatus IITB7]|uniref:plasmid replication protein, CyRepA1 family n=1 Tax=Synechococcus elongatus TaxID=32046 RepID=UPI0030CE8DB6
MLSPIVNVTKAVHNCERYDIATPPTRQQLLETLDRLPREWRFCVVNERKAPFDPDWQKTPLDHAAVAERIKSDRRITGIGLLTGHISGGLVAVDFDGPTAHEALPEGLTLAELPVTVAYTSGKTGRHQRLYKVPFRLWETTATRKTKSSDGDLLELRWAGLQSVIVGQHPETGAYRWVEGCAPWEVEVAEAPPEILDAMARKQSTPRPYKPIVSAPASDDEVAIARAMLAHVPASYADDYDSWLTVGMALQSVDDCLLDDWIAWSAQSPKFDGEHRLERKWSSFQGAGITIATLAKLAKEGGYRPTRQGRQIVQRRMAKHLKLLSRDPNRLHTGGWLTADYIPAPKQHRLICLHAPMSTGKTEAIAAHLKPLIDDGVPVVLITHRRTLGESLSKRLGVPWAEECIPGSKLRFIGIGGCIDSMHPNSKLKFYATHWEQAIVVLDEVELWLDHLVNGKTDVAKHRPEIMAEIAKVLSSARQVIAADALLSDVTVNTLEALTGDRAYLVSSTVQPFSNVPVYFLEDEAQLAALIVQFAQEGQRLWVSTDKQKLSKRTGKPSLYSAATLARMLSDVTGEDVQPIDSAANHRGELQALKANPMEYINQQAHIVATSVIDAGLSVTQGEDDREFDAMLVFAGSGHLTPGAIVQTLGRIRSNIPRFIVCPELSNKLRTGNGAIDPTEVAEGLNSHKAVALAQIAQAGIKIGEPVAAQAYLQAWAELAARRNREGLAYAATVEELLRANGFIPQQWNGVIDPFHQAACSAIQRETAEALTEAETIAILNAQNITSADAELIANEEVVTAQEQAELKRYQLLQRWGACTRELLAANDEGLYAPLQLFYWFTLGTTAATERDVAKLEQRRDRAMFAPDLVDACIAPQVRYLVKLQLGKLLNRRDWFGVDDPLVQEIVSTVNADRMTIGQVLGLDINNKTRASTVIRRILKKVGFKLKARQKRIAGKQTWIYQVISDEALVALPLEQIFGYWLQKADQVRDWDAVTKIPIDLLLSHFMTSPPTGNTQPVAA